MKERPEKVGDITVKEKLKYLGVTIVDKRNCFKLHKDEIISKARKMANLTQNVVGKSCNRMLIGKTFWKSVALPSILYGANIVDFNRQDLEKLQRIENSVSRKILNAPNYGQESALRGEIGMSSMRGRIMEGQLKYLQYILRGESNKLLERVIEEMRMEKKKSKWISDMMENRKLIGIKGENVSNNEISEKVKKWDTHEWKKRAL